MIAISSTTCAWGRFRPKAKPSLNVQGDRDICGGSLGCQSNPTVWLLPDGPFLHGWHKGTGGLYLPLGSLEAIS